MLPAGSKPNAGIVVVVVVVTVIVIIMCSVIIKLISSCMVCGTARHCINKTFEPLLFTSQLISLLSVIIFSYFLLGKWKDSTCRPQFVSHCMLGMSSQPQGVFFPVFLIFSLSSIV